MIYFMYVIFRMPIDSNFIAVVLMILGYSLNDTIVIYDRVREERKALGRKTDAGMVFNLSATKSLKRTIITSVTTLSAILIVYIVALVYNISSVQAFALPMIIGIISVVILLSVLQVLFGYFGRERKRTAKRNMRLF